MGDAAVGATAAESKKPESLSQKRPCYTRVTLCRSRLSELAPSFDLLHYLGVAIGSGHGATRTRQDDVQFGLYGWRKRARDAPGLFCEPGGAHVAGRRRVLLCVCASGVYLSTFAASGGSVRWSPTRKTRSARRVGASGASGTNGSFLRRRGENSEGVQTLRFKRERR